MRGIITASACANKFWYRGREPCLSLRVSDGRHKFINIVARLAGDGSTVHLLPTCVEKSPVRR